MATFATLVVIVADRVDAQALVRLAGRFVETMAGCNKQLMARFLFWAPFAYEVWSLAAAVRLRSSTRDVEAYQASMSSVLSTEDGRRSDLTVRKIAIAVVVFGIAVYWASYSLAYNNQRLCLGQGLGFDVRHYLYLFATCLARGFVVLIARHLFLMSLKPRHPY
jgi:hypothetical protein